MSYFIFYNKTTYDFFVFFSQINFLFLLKMMYTVANVLNILWGGFATHLILMGKLQKRINYSKSKHPHKKQGKGVLRGSIPPCFLFNFIINKKIILFYCFLLKYNLHLAIFNLKKHIKNLQLKNLFCIMLLLLF